MIYDHGLMYVLCWYLIQRAVLHPEASRSVNGPICITGNQLRGRQSDTFKIRRLINHGLGQQAGREGGHKYIVSLTTEEQPDSSTPWDNNSSCHAANTRATPSIEQIRNKHPKKHCTSTKRCWRGWNWGIKSKSKAKKKSKMC